LSSPMLVRSRGRFLKQSSWGVALSSSAARPMLARLHKM
jgi:hypothetical protein